MTKVKDQHILANTTIDQNSCNVFFSRLVPMDFKHYVNKND